MTPNRPAPALTNALASIVVKFPPLGKMTFLIILNVTDFSLSFYIL
jgi:hypothetical protein